MYRLTSSSPWETESLQGDAWKQHSGLHHVAAACMKSSQSVLRLARGMPEARNISQTIRLCTSSIPRGSPSEQQNCFIFNLWDTPCSPLEIITSNGTIKNTEEFARKMWSREIKWKRLVPCDFPDNTHSSTSALRTPYNLSGQRAPWL